MKRSAYHTFEITVAALDTLVNLVECSSRAGKTARSGKCLPYTHKDPSSIPGTMQKEKLDVRADAYNPNDGEVETGRFLGFPGQPA